MAVGTIAGLTLREAVRKKTLVGALLMGLLIVGMSLLLLLARARMEHGVEVHRLTPEMFATRYVIVRSVFLSLCLFMIKMFGALFAVLLAGGAISGEIERGLLAVVLPKPIGRWQILLGKWIGLNIILIGSVLVWTVLTWASFTFQAAQNGDHELDYAPLLRAGPILALYPVIISTLSLSLSTFAQRLFGTSLALTLCAFSFFDGIFNAIGKSADVDALVTVANVASLVVPQGSVAWWVEDTVTSLLFQNPGKAGQSPRFLEAWGNTHLHIPHLDAVYLVCYTLALLFAGMVVFQKRDV